MKIVIHLFILLASIAGVVCLFRLSNDNRQLSGQITQLEAELGRMSIDDPKRVYLVEIVMPDVPPEVAAHVEQVWQFRCYLPPGYDVMRFSGGGRVTKEGCYLNGSSSSAWGSPPREAIHELLTVSFQRKGDRLEAFYSFGGSSGTSSWGDFNPGRFDETLVVQKLVSSEHGPRSFDESTILPLLKIFDSATAETVDYLVEFSNQHLEVRRELEARLNIEKPVSLSAERINSLGDTSAFEPFFAVVARRFIGSSILLL